MRRRARRSAPIQLRYRYTPFGGPAGNWIVWNTFPGATGSANFDYAALGLGNGLYEFNAVATNSVGQTEPFDPNNPRGASVILDLNDEINLWIFFPLAFNHPTD